MSAVHETWVMPIAPIRVAEGVEYDAARGVEFAVTDLAAGIDPDGETVTLSATNWVEVPAPIVWDGSLEALERVRNAFEGTANYASLDDNPSAGWGHGGCLWIGVGQESSMAPSGWRIQIIGDSFAILPPAQESDQEVSE